MRIEALKLVCRDLDAQRHFYSEVLGLPLLDNAGARFTVQVGRTRLSFRHQPETVGVYHFAFNIPENQLAQARGWVAKRAALLAEDGNDEFTASKEWNAHMFYFRDADGNILECIARHRLQNASYKAFGPASLLSISEIGIPVEKMPQSVERLSRKLGLTVFGSASDTFTPLGDDEGLLIVVQVGRAWFPTKDTAAAMPFDLAVDGETHDFSSRAFDTKDGNLLCPTNGSEIRARAGGSGQAPYGCRSAQDSGVGWAFFPGNITDKCSKS